MMTLTLTDPGDLIATVPSILGYEPSNGVVVVGLAPDGRLEMTTHVDAHRATDPELRGDIAQLLARSDVHEAVLVAWCHASCTEPCSVLHRIHEVVEPVCDIGAAWVTNGIEFARHYVADTGWVADLAEEVPHVYRHGRGEHEVPGDPGDSAIPTRALRVTTASRRNAKRAAQRWDKRRDGDRSRWCRDSWNHVLSSGNAASSDATWGKVMAALRDVRVRDALIVMWLGASPEVIEDVLDGVVNDGVHAVMDGALRPGLSHEPGSVEIAKALDWCTTVFQYSAGEDRAISLTLMGLLHWWAGDVHECRMWVDAAGDCDPTYTLALLLRDMCAAGLLPGWQRE